MAANDAKATSRSESQSDEAKKERKLAEIHGQEQFSALVGLLGCSASRHITAQLLPGKQQQFTSGLSSHCKWDRCEVSHKCFVARVYTKFYVFVAPEATLRHNRILIKCSVNAETGTRIR